MPGNRAAILRILLLGTFLLSGIAGAAQGEAPPRRSSEEVIAALREKRGKELTRFLRGLPRVLEEVELSDRHLESLLAELQRIQETDPCQEKVSGWIEIKGVGIGGDKVFVNREAASLLRLTLPEWVDRHRLRLWLKGLRELPLEERTTKILSRIESLQRPLETTHPLIRGLTDLGDAGVPFILRYPSQDNLVRLAIVEALSHIRDPRGAEFIIGLLQTKGEYAFPYRAAAVRALGRFEGEKVVRALTEVLRENGFQEGFRRIPTTATMPLPESKPPLYEQEEVGLLREAASSLRAVTGKDFGILFNEEYKTWAGWLEAPDPQRFRPAALGRSEGEMRWLIENLFRRYLDGTTKMPENPENSLVQKKGIKSAGEDLRSLGKRVVPLLVFQCRIRMEQNPRQEKELKAWTQKLLRSLKWPEASRAAASL